MIVAVAGSGCWWNASLPGTIAYNRRIEREANARAALVRAWGDSATSWQVRFLGCAEAYGRTHANANATVTEVGDAAVAACADEMGMFTMYQRNFRASVDAEAAASAAGVVRAHADAADKIAVEVRDLALRGNQSAIKAALEKRP
jgi:hypothetical protein